MRFSIVALASTISAAAAMPADVAALQDRTIAFPECLAACTLFCMTHGDAPCVAACVPICAASVEPGTPITEVKLMTGGLGFVTKDGQVNSGTVQV
ncbi:hypothetical protein CCM_07885 [Cordyceps militaris CM01]|uniref:Uncharacterized protein n=1 Tax=Cordyceps militaris (strain CM01) TaxID=983644 RepID=G3JP23_CORMM|nr:uncharacterized protein CCM_07885 [Cordyceps militaris CM01]EGX89633.1 hypothetical protein CCM_07885 [Cordyceps militaris CM01]